MKWLTKIKQLDLKKIRSKKAAKGSKKLFWAWIIYQAIKGTLTTSLIWAPMFYLWWQSR